MCKGFGEYFEGLATKFANCVKYSGYILIGGVLISVGVWLCWNIFVHNTTPGSNNN